MEGPVSAHHHKSDKKERKTSIIKKRGVGLDVEINPPTPTPEEEAIKKFGPCHVDAKQAYTAILLLKSEEIHIVIESLNSLQKFCKKRQENKEIFVQLEGIQAAYKLIHSLHQVTQRLAMKLIAMNSNIHKTKLICRDLNIVQDVIQLGESSKDDVIIEYSTLILSNCATLYTGRLQIIQHNGIPLLLHLITHNDDPDIQKNSAETIWRILEEPLNWELLNSEQSIKPIIGLCDSEYPAIQIIALSILEKFSKKFAGVKILENLNMVKYLGEKLGLIELGDIHRVILKILINLAISNDSCKQLSALMGDIVSLLDNSKDLKAQNYAIVLMGKIGADPILTRSIVDVGVTQKIITILATYADVEIREACAFTSAQLASADHRAKQYLIAAIRPLIVFLNDSHITPKGIENALHTLSVILEEGVTSCPLFIEENGLKFLMKIFLHNAKYSDEALISAMTCLSHILTQWTLRKQLVSEGLVQGVLGCFGRPNPQVLALSTNSMCGLLCEEDGRKQFMTLEGYNVVSAILESCEEFPVATALVPLIHIIGNYPKLSKEFIEKGVLATIWKRQDLISFNGPFRTAYEQLISSHLPAKFAITGHIDPFELLPNGFYDSGHLKKNENFQPLVQLTYEERDPEKRIMYLNLDATVEPELLENNPSLQAMIDQNQTIEPYVTDVITGIETGLIKSEKELVALISTVISNKFGGPLDKWKISAQSEDLEFVDLQNKYESVVIPLTMLNTGAHRPRALLFKALADKFGIPCTLDRGGYKKYWNVVLLNSWKTDDNYCPCIEIGENKKNPVFTEKLRRFVVDLIYQPGSLFPLHSYEANAYCFY